jgi:hypothetical protein
VAGEDLSQSVGDLVAITDGKPTQELDALVVSFTSVLSFHLPFFGCKNPFSPKLISQSLINTSLSPLQQIKIPSICC